MKPYNKSKETFIKFIKECIVIVLFFFLFIYKIPYFIYKPGGSINLSDRINIDNDYPMEGSYSMNYVSVVKANIPGAILSFLIKDWQLVKDKQIIYENMDYETSLEIGKLEYKMSIDGAILTAYEKAGKKVEYKSEKDIVLYVQDETKTDVKLLDQILEFDGTKFNEFKDLKNYILNQNIGDKIELKVLNKGKEYLRKAEIYEYEGQKVIGVGVYKTFEYETDPKINITTSPSEAGSSGGLMLTLAIYDSLVEEDLSKGLTIMGTGTIEEDGKIGAIGGVKYKMLGAKKDNAHIFFVPKDNYDEALKFYEEREFNFKLVMVETIDEAINYLESLEK